MFGMAFGDVPFGSFIDWSDEVPAIGFISETMPLGFISQKITLEFESA